MVKQAKSNLVSIYFEIIESEVRIKKREKSKKLEKKQDKEPKIIATKVVLKIQESIKNY